MAEQPFTFRNKHLAGAIELLRKQHEASLSASANDPEAAVSFDSERMDLARRTLNGMCNGTVVGDTDPVLDPQERSLKGGAIKPGSQEKATGDTGRASDTRFAYDNRGNPVSIESIFASDNASQFHRRHSVDEIVGEFDGAQRGHDIDSIFFRRLRRMRWPWTKSIAAPPRLLCGWLGPAFIRAAVVQRIAELTLDDPALSERMRPELLRQARALVEVLAGVEAPAAAGNVLRFARKR
jgi:hypothetical protein